MTDLGVTFYRGPSLLTGDPIVGLLTGLDGGSKNPKTGPMAQAWVLRADLPPMEAKRRNLDDAICGDCQLRGRDGRESGCYVPVWVAPMQVWKAYQAGRYPVVSWPELQAVVESRGLRLCAYGDPAAVPFDVWRIMLVTAATHVAYTHAWRACDPRLKTIAMASVDSETEFVLASLAGWRTFRIRPRTGTLIAGAEFVCPASEEGGLRVTCAECRLCRGQASPARSVAIYPHGKASSLRMFPLAERLS